MGDGHRFSFPPSRASLISLISNHFTGGSIKLSFYGLSPRQPCPVAAEACYGSIIAAKLAIAGELATPLAKLPTGDRQFTDQLLSETLIRRIVLDRVRAYFRRHKKEDDHAS